MGGGEETLSGAGKIDPGKKTGGGGMNPGSHPADLPSPNFLLLQGGERKKQKTKNG